MTPKPQYSNSLPAVADDNTITTAADLHQLNDDSVVISGMSGLYPQSHNIKEFAEILYNKVNPVTREASRYQCDHPEVVPHVGTIPDLDTFDAQFFKVHNRLAMSMDSMSRKILEQAFQAIYDAGVSPYALSEKKVGVFIGSGFSETDKAVMYRCHAKDGFGITGCSKTMFANRVSYWLNARGPSMAIDNACSSSMTALEQAVAAIKRGDCEAAIVGGTYLCLHPQSSVHYGRITKTCKDGNTRSFDENANGCSKSESINVLYLQKAKDAMRIYAEVIDAKTEFVGIMDDNTGPKLGFSRHVSSTTDFMKKIYRDASITPNNVEYVEAFGCADPESDKLELEAIEEVFCKDKPEPLLIGSIMSNIGYTEAASGISAVTKVLLGYHTGEIAANLNCTQPRQDVCALRDGRMRVVSENQRFRRTFVGVNNMNVSGITAHALLHGHYKPKNTKRYHSDIPYIVTVSGRHEAMVKHILEELKSNPIDPEQIALLHNIHKTNCSGYLGRGFTILQTDELENTKVLCEKAEFFDDAQRPLWFVYSGMGSQWVGMGAQLMRIPIFAAAIQRCHQALEPKGINIVDIITSSDKKMFDNILHSFVGIAAVQIGLTDILHEIGLVPEGIVGHSVGELGCAYADGCLSAEEMILAAYSRGLVSLQTPLVRGSMAAVGVGFTKISELCPPEIDVACHNGPDSCTISGPADAMREFVAELTTKGIFAKEVPCSNIAYHSRYIADAGPGLLKYLKDVIKSPKPRSSRWLSSSIPQNKWQEPLAKLCSAEYHTNNLLNPVLFEETSKLIPSNAVVVEVAPHGLLQAILKRSLPESCTNIPMTRRQHADNTLFVLEAIGKLFMQGYNPKLDALYPKIDFPVSTGTPFLSHLIQWSHDDKYGLPLYTNANRIKAVTCSYMISCYDQENTYLRGHNIRGYTVHPYAASLMLVWDTFSMAMGVPKKEMAVTLSDLHLFAQPVLHDRRQVNLNVLIQRGTGKFEVINDEGIVVTGLITEHNKLTSKQNRIKILESNRDTLVSSEDVYNILLDRDYNYSGEFRSIASASSCLSSCELEWRDNWVTLIDGMLQLNMLQQAHSGVSLPTYIRSVCIDVDLHKQFLSESTKLLVESSNTYDRTRCGGVLIENIKFEHLPPKKYTEIIILKDLMSGSVVEPEGEGQCQTSGNVKLECTQVGNYDSLKWVVAPEEEKTGTSVAIHYADINNMDVKRLNGTHLQKVSDNAYGMNFSGITDGGVRVMGIAPSGAVISHVRAVPELLWPIPSHWSLEDAATVPFAYALAFYTLSVKFDLFPEMRVYVHGASGAVGQAAVSIALAAGCKVFASVSNIRKKTQLLKLYPELKAQDIGCSRDVCFDDFVMTATNGKGCDVLISTARGINIKNILTKCCADSGVVIDLTQVTDHEQFVYGMSNLTKARSYKTVDFSSIGVDEMKKIQALITDGIARGYVRPLPRVTFQAHEASRAFRLVAKSQHFGRVLLKLQQSVKKNGSSLVCRPEDSHLVLCDDDTFALQIVDRLIKRGVKKLLLHHKNPSNVFLQNKMRLWKTKNVQVEISSENLNNEQDIINLFNKAMLLGDLEGVYFVTGDSYKDHEFILHKLDTVSRNLCSKLRYFAVLNIGNSNEVLGKTTIYDRINERLPALSIQLPNLEKRYPQRVAALDAVEQALSGTSRALVATELQTPSPRLLQLLSPLAGIQLSEQNNKNITLEELGLQNDRIPSLYYFLRTEYNIALNEDKIPLLTIEKLLEFEADVTEFPYEDIKGLSTFLGHIYTDELLATSDIVCLPTLTNSSTMRDDEFSANEKYMCIVPGIEGHHERFRTLCSRLKMPALVLQPGLDHPHESVQEAAERNIQTLLSKSGAIDNFYILGYESGAIVALEMAAILESRGFTGTVFCIGHSPDELKDMFDDFLSSFDSDEQLEDAVLRHMYKLMTGDSDTEALENALQNVNTWSLKVDICVRILLGRVSHSAQYARGLIEAALGRIQQIRKYRATAHSLLSKIVLLRAPSDDKSQRYSLQQYCSKPVMEYQLRAPLAHSSSDLLCAAIINSNLDSAIIQKFETKNICDTYLINSDAFMSPTK